MNSELYIRVNHYTFSGKGGISRLLYQSLMVLANGKVELWDTPNMLLKASQMFMIRLHIKFY